MPTHPIYGNFLASFTPMVGVSIGLPNPISGGLSDPAGMISSYNPHFFVDASSSMLGVLESTSLDLDPSNASSLDIITATRAGTATYTDANGNIQLADPNTVRVDHVDGVPMILVEPAATNLAKYTDFSSGWTTLGASPVTSETGEGYAGQSSVILTATAATGRFRQGLSEDIAGFTYTASIWIRRVSGSGSIRFEHNSSPTGGSSSPLNITTEWSRVEAQFEGDCFAWGIQIDTSGDAVEIAMPQVEAGSVATSYIPTAGSAVTRAADDLVIDGSDFTDFYNDAEGTVYVEYEPRVLGTTNTTLEFSDGTADNRIFSLAYSAYHCYIINGGVNQAVLDGGTNTTGVLNRLAFSYEANNIQASLEGGAVVSDTSASIPTVDRLILGNQTVANTRLLNGHIKRLLYWPHHSDNI